jgi:putative transposase
MRDHDISQRRACRLVGVDPKTFRRERPPDNPDIRKEMKAVAAKRRRFGYRRIGVMLERKGMIMNHKKLYRLGDTTTTKSGHTHRSKTKHPQKRAGRLRNLRAPRPAGLPKLTTTNMKTRPADSRYE